MKKINTVCIVDDDDIYVRLTKRLIQSADFADNTLVFKNGLDAIKYIKENKAASEKLPDAILLDLNMPIMDGWQFLDEFSESPPEKNIAIYIISSSIDPVDLTKSKEYPVVKNYFTKPVQVNTLEEINSSYASV